MISLKTLLVPCLFLTALSFAASRGTVHSSLVLNPDSRYELELIEVGDNGAYSLQIVSPSGTRQTIALDPIYYYPSQKSIRDGVTYWRQAGPCQPVIAGKEFLLICGTREGARVHRIPRIYTENKSTSFHSSFRHLEVRGEHYYVLSFRVGPTSSRDAAGDNVLIRVSDGKFIRLKGNWPAYLTEESVGLDPGDELVLQVQDPNDFEPARVDLDRFEPLDRRSRQASDGGSKISSTKTFSSSAKVSNGSDAALVDDDQATVTLRRSARFSSASSAGVNRGEVTSAQVKKIEPSTAREKKVPAAPARPKAKKTNIDQDGTTASLGDGTKILYSDSPEPQVFVQSLGSPEKTLLSKGEAKWIPINKELESDQFYPLEKDASYAPVVTSSGAFAVLQGGKVLRFPLDLKRLFGESPTEFTVNDTLIEHKGSELMLISWGYAGAGDPSEGPALNDTYASGETYLYSWEEDLLFRVDSLYHDELDEDPNAWKITDGILRINGSPRAIDLDRLRGESRVRISAPDIVVDGEGAIIEDLQLEFQRSFANLTQEFLADPSQVFGASASQEEVERRIRVALARAETGNAILLGDAGVGKTELIRTLVSGIVQGRFPEIPRTTQVIRVDAGTLQQGTQYTGQFETRVNLLIQACREIPCLLFMDEMHSLRGAGTSSTSNTDFFQLLKPALAAGNIRAIGASTRAEYDEAMAGDLALVRRFTTVYQDEPPLAEVPGYLERWTKRFSKATPSQEVLEAVARLASQFNAYGANPTKSKDLLEQVYAEMEIAGRFDEAPILEDLYRAARVLYSLAPEHFDEASARALYDQAPAVIERYIVGQPWAKKVLYRLLKDKLAGTQDPQRPAIRLLLAGPPGVGKTELGLALAHALKVPSTRIEMNKYAEGGVEKFRRELAQAIRKNAQAVIILDEIEKAHPDVQAALLAVLDSGVMEVRENINSNARNSGQMVKVNFRHASFIATTNAGQDFVRSKDPAFQRTMGFAAGAPKEKASLNEEELQEELKKSISDATLDRFQHTSAVFPPTQVEFRSIIELHLDRALQEQSLQQGATITLQNRDEFLDFAVEHYYRPGRSNRVAHEITQFVIRSQIADQKFAGNLEKGAELKLRFDRGTYLRSIDFQSSGCDRSLAI